MSIITNSMISHSEDNSISGGSEADQSLNEEQCESNSDADESTQEMEGDQSDNEDKIDSTANLGWADSIAKILKTNKPERKKTIVLSKAKRLTDVKTRKAKDVGFEIATKEGQIKRESIIDDSDEQPKFKRKKDLPTYRIKPNILDKDRERLLSKIATKGVVQLFNAVKNQQKDIDTKLKDVGSIEVKRDKVLKNMDKREFLNVLLGKKGNAGINNKKEKIKQPKSESSDTPTWSVLRDDFLMSAKMKDWDKKLEDSDSIKDEDDD